MEQKQIARILVVEDHPLVRLGLSCSLESHPRFTKCGEADSEVDAWDLVQSTKPDAVIVDLTLASGSGLDFIKKLSKRRPEVEVVVSSMHDRSVYEQRTKRAGAAAYVSKESGVDALLAALEKAVFSAKDGGRPQGVCREPHSESGQFPITSLTDRELEVFRLIGKGKSTRQIASKQSKSIKTIESYRAKIKKKIGVATTEELARDAVRWVFEHDAA